MELVNETRIEEEYLSETLSQIDQLLSKELTKNTDRQKNIVSSKKEMWDNPELFSARGFDGLLAFGQSFEPINMQITTYESSANKINIYEKMLNNPYFARIDFTEEDENEEKIYIGRASILNDDTYKMYVYDWRAPISSIFYRFEPGEAHYDAPMGKIQGILSLKRQYEIENGKLSYFFDASINIVDEILRKMLAENTSPKMKAIVETIQRNQDIIIRDMQHDLLIVQGVAGSGKTSVALHRVAYLMYQGLSSRLNAGDIIIISPNNLFSQYISEVLPELGESNIDSFIFEDLCRNILNPISCTFQTRNQFFEKLITCVDAEQKKCIKNSMEFKTSRIFLTILDRYAETFEKQTLVLPDIYYDDTCIFDSQTLLGFISKEGVSAPLTVRLKNLERVIFEKVRGMRKDRIKKLEALVREQGEHVLEVPEYARLLSIQESSALLDTIHSFTELDTLEIYRRLIEDRTLFYQMAEGLTLPENMENILDYSREKIQSGELLYEDGLSLSYFKILLCGVKRDHNIKQVVVDEAQDYYTVHFELLKRLFGNAKYTILGDINQTIEKQADLTLYDDVRLILNRKKSSLVSMLKSFRCTTEILNFSENYIDNQTKPESFNRSGEAPKVVFAPSPDEIPNLLLSEIQESKELGYESIGILCSSRQEAEYLYAQLKDKMKIKIIDESSLNVVTGVFIIPIYMAKGLEFDSVLVYGMNPNSKEEAEQKLLYIACTRALHRLSLFSTNSDTPKEG